MKSKFDKYNIINIWNASIAELSDTGLFSMLLISVTVGLYLIFILGYIAYLIMGWISYKRIFITAPDDYIIISILIIIGLYIFTWVIITINIENKLERNKNESN